MTLRFWSSSALLLMGLGFTACAHLKSSPDLLQSMVTEQGFRSPAGASLSRTLEGTHQYGRFEARIKPDCDAAKASGFSLYQQNPNQQITLQILPSNQLQTKVGVNDKETKKVFDLGFNACEKAHLYTIEWSRDRVSFYVDNRWFDTRTENLPTEALQGVIAGAEVQAALVKPSNLQDLIAQMSLDEKISLLGGAADGFSTNAIPRLGIPSLVMTDGPAGVRIGQGTAFPVPIAMAATFDPELIEQTTQAMGLEVKSFGKDILLAPCINIARIPLGGRTFEGMGEDPYLIGQMASHYIRGLQSVGVMTSLKHYALNNQEHGRMTVDVQVPEKALRDLYLPAFEMGVGETPATVMAAYNKVRGSYAAENDYLLNKILKQEMGYPGIVVSDWGAVHSTVPSALHGLDLEMPTGSFFASPLKQAVMSGQVPMASIDEKVRRILWVLDQFHLLGRGKAKAVAANPRQSFDQAVKVAESSIVLLKNDNHLLPLNPHQAMKIAVIGPSAKVARTGGGGSSYVQPKHPISAWQGLQQRLKLWGSPVQLSFAQGSLMDEEAQPFDFSLLRTVKDGGGTTQGLKGEYFSNENLQGQPVMTRVDAIPQFNWNWDSPNGAVMGQLNFSVRWTGEFVPKKTGMHEFLFSSDDGIRVFINDQAVIDAWNQVELAPHHFMQRFVAGQVYKLRIEYVQHLDLATFLMSIREPGKDGNLTDLLTEAANTAKNADVALVFVGLNNKNESESFDRRSFALDKEQSTLIQTVAKNNPRIVVVVQAGSPIDLSWQTQIPSLVYAWYPGEFGGLALADLLMGATNPSGKLPLTLPVDLNSVPAMHNYPGLQDQVTYAEGMAVGYRGIQNPAYAFGYGLSYSDFVLGETNLQVVDGSVASPKVNIEADLQNLSDINGAEVVQVYVKHPGSQTYWNLKSFQKVFVAKKSAQKVKLSLDRSAFAQYDDEQKTKVVYPGAYDVQVRIGSKAIVKDLTLQLK